jgi:hypothetical protein
MQPCRLTLLKSSSEVMGTYEWEPKLLNPAVVLLFSESRQARCLAPQIKHLAQAGVRPSEMHTQGSPTGSPSSFIMHTGSLTDCNHGFWGNP